ncbi:hypothetical protein FACS1894105_13650 [Clostridia bacterium]|nr:hypothetical protein FACS1894105_13650 [Clostridia bacterium]
MAEEINELSFENSLRELEAIVKSLESGSATLDESLQKFETGINLVRRCNTLLDNAEKRVKKLTRSDNGEVVEQDFVPLQ